MNKSIPCGINTEFIEESPSLGSDGVNIETEAPLLRKRMAGRVFISKILDLKFPSLFKKPNIYKTPKYQLRHLSIKHSAIDDLFEGEITSGHSETEELFLLLSQLFVSLEALQSQCVELSSQDSDFKEHFILLSDEVFKLKRVSREALRRLEVVSGSVKYFLEEYSDLFQEEEKDTDDRRGNNADDDFVRDSSEIEK